MIIKNEKELLALALDAAWQKDNPRLAWMLSNLAGITKVTFSDKIETACIKKSGKTYTIVFSRKFVEKYLSCPDDILFVLLHEIMHKVKGDLLRNMILHGSIDRTVANIVEDILINAFLCRLFFLESVPLFDKLYDPQTFPGVILTTPVNLCCKQKEKHLDNAEWELDPSFPPADITVFLALLKTFRKHVATAMEKVRDLPEPDLSCFGIDDEQATHRMLLADWYLKAWLENDKTTMYQLYEWIRPFFPENPVVVLLGDHLDKSGEFDDWGEIFNHRGGHSNDEDEDRIDVEQDTKYAGQIVRMIRQAIEPDPFNPREAPVFMPERTVLPWPGRRENLWLAHGLWPVFFKAPALAKELDYLRPHIYIDVSASTSPHQPLIYGIITHLGDIIGEPIYLFSNTVAEATLEDIRNGKVTTTGGTDYDCIMEHASARGFRKLIIITDGYGEMNNKNAARLILGEIEIYLILTHHPRYLNDCLGKHAKQIFYLM